MKKVEKILAPTDLSELSCFGLRYALELARGWGASVTVYHTADVSEIAHYKAQSIPDLVGQHQAALSKFLEANCADLLPLVEVREKVEIGTPGTNIVDEAEKEGVDLIVMSTHGRTGFSHLLMGSVTEKVVRLAPCPVFSVHQPRPRQDAKEEPSRGG
jgi:nucleotide-binding universal stress UspA family protein